MSNYTLVYDPKKVSVTIGGQTVFGYAEGSLISIDKADNVTSTVEGCDGNDTTISVSPKRGGTATLTLQHTSPFNKFLYAWAEAYARDPSSATVLMPFQIDDPASVQINTICWLEQVPSFGLAAETSELSWVFRLKDATPKSNTAYSFATAIGDLSGIQLPTF